MSRVSTLIHVKPTWGRLARWFHSKRIAQLQCTQRRLAGTNERRQVWPHRTPKRLHAELLRIKRSLSVSEQVATWVNFFWWRQYGIHTFQIQSYVPVCGLLFQIIILQILCDNKGNPNTSSHIFDHKNPHVCSGNKGHNFKPANKPRDIRMRLRNAHFTVIIRHGKSELGKSITAKVVF
jgi:hypothetical protein